MKVKLRLLCSDAAMSAPLLGPGTLQMYVKPTVTNLGVKLGCSTFPDLHLLAYYMSCGISMLSQHSIKLEKLYK